MEFNITTVPSDNLQDLEIYLDGQKVRPISLGIEKELICYDKEFPMETGRKYVTLKFLATVEGKV